MPLTIEQADDALSSRRSFSRCRVLVALDDHGGVMRFNELAHECGWDATRLREVLFGDDVSFSRGRSPVRLGQVDVVRSSHGDVVILLERGHREVVALRKEHPWSRGRGRGVSPG